MQRGAYKNMIGRAAVAALCVALLIFIALIPCELCGVIAGLSLLVLLCGLFAVSFSVFLPAAGGGILDIYYKEVSLAAIDGVTHPVKVYGPAHSVYSV